MAKSQVWSGSAWIDLYTLPTATTSALGGIKLGYTSSGKNYKVQVDGSGNAYVNVPWTNTINSAGSGNTSNKIYLVGTTTQNSSGKTTYSHDTVYVDIDGCVYSNGYKTMTQNDTPYTTTINYAQDLIINSNGVNFSDYWGKNVTFTNFSYPNYTVKQMVVDGEPQINDLDLVREYMKFMTGQAIIPKYVSNIPADTFIYSNSTDQLWKMQYDDTHGLLAFLVNGVSLKGSSVLPLVATALSCTEGMSYHGQLDLDNKLTAGKTYLVKGYSDNIGYYVSTIIHIESTGSANIASIPWCSGESDEPTSATLYISHDTAIIFTNGVEEGIFTYEDYLEFYLLPYRLGS